MTRAWLLLFLCLWVKSASAQEKAEIKEAPPKRHWSVGVNGLFIGMFDKPTASGGVFPSSPAIGLEATLHHVFMRGFAIGLDGAYGWVGGVVSTDLVPQTEYSYSLVTLGLTGLYEIKPERRWVPFFGLRVGLNMMTRELAALGDVKQTYNVLTPALVGGVRWRFAKAFAAALRVRVHYLHYTVEGIRPMAYGDVGLALQYEWDK